VRRLDGAEETRPADSHMPAWTRSRQRRTISFRARLTVERCSSIEARRLEGLLRVRVAVPAAPERGAARGGGAGSARPPRPTVPVPLCCQKEETMNHEQAQANLELVLDWIDALRRNDVDAIAERFHPEVAWEDVAGGTACEGREQVLAWLRAAPSQPTDVDAL